MKKLLSILSVIVCLTFIISSCDPKNPVDEVKGTLESATYDPATKSFKLTYSSGQTETVKAVIDNSVIPPSASVTLKDGTVISVTDANKSGTATITTSAQVSNAKYVNEWIYKNMNIYYLWNNKIPKSPNYSLNPKDFFGSLLNSYNQSTNPEGDRFSWIQESYVDLLNSLGGVTSDEIGFDFTLIPVDEAETHYYALVLYTKLGTDALAKGIKRGRFITKINGQNITAQNYKSLFSGTGTKTLSMADWVYNSSDNKYHLTISDDVTISMHKNFAENPIYLDSVYTINDKKIGYLVYNFFARDKGDKSYTYDKQLINTLERIQSKGATEMVLDLRYNGGGAVSSAIALASALVKNRSTSNVFGVSQYNALVDSELKKEYGADYNKDYFVDKIQTSETQSISVPSLNFSRLHVLVGRGSASASELVINGLKPYMDVVLIGRKTYGKNVGSISLYEKNDPKNKWGMQPIIVKYYNSAGQSEYTSGFAPNFEVNEFENLFFYQFGDTDDPLLNKAIANITGTTRSTNLTEPITETRSMAIENRITPEKKHQFEMYDDVREDAIRNIMKK